MENLENLIKEFTTKCRTESKINEELLNKFLIEEDIKDLSDREKNYILASSKEIHFKRKLLRGSSDILSKISEQLIGEGKLSSRFLEQFTDIIRTGLFEFIGEITGQFTEDLVTTEKVTFQTDPRFPSKIYSDFSKIRYKIHEEVEKFLLNESSEELFESYIKLSNTEKEELRKSLVSNIVDWIQKRLRYITDWVRDLNFADLPQTEYDLVLHRALTDQTFSLRDNVNNIFTINFIDLDIQKEDFDSILSEHFEDKKASIKNTVNMYFGNRGFEDSLKDKAVKYILGQYRETFLYQLDKLNRTKGTTIREVRKEIFNKRLPSSEKITPKIFANEEDFVSSIESSIMRLKKCPSINFYDDYSKDNLLGLIKSALVTLERHITVPKFIEGLKNDINYNNLVSLVDGKRSGIITTKGGVMAFKLISRQLRDLSRVTIFLYVDENTEELRAFVPIKGNVLDDEKKALGQLEDESYEEGSSRSIKFIDENYKEQFDKILPRYNKKDLEKFFLRNAYILDCNESICLDEFEQSYK